MTSTKDGILSFSGDKLSEGYGLRASGKFLEVGGFNCPKRGTVLELKKIEEPKPIKKEIKKVKKDEGGRSEKVSKKS